MSQGSGRSRIGETLRVLRERAGLSGDAVAAAMGWSQSKVSRIETGRFGVTVQDVNSLLNHYGASEGRLDSIEEIQVEHSAALARVEDVLTKITERLA